jgi:hypothetical protein
MGRVRAAKDRSFRIKGEPAAWRNCQKSTGLPVCFAAPRPIVFHGIARLRPVVFPCPRPCAPGFFDPAILKESGPSLAAPPTSPGPRPFASIALCWVKQGIGMSGQDLTPSPTALRVLLWIFIAVGLGNVVWDYYNGRSLGSIVIHDFALIAVGAFGLLWLMLRK